MRNGVGKKHEIIGILQDLGLTEIESLVYSFIYQNGGATTRDILRSLNLRQPQLYDITSGLERKGFINVIVERPLKYRAINPEIVYQQRENLLKEEKDIFLEWVNTTAPSNYREEPEIFIARNNRSFLSNTLFIIKEAKEIILIHTTLIDLENYLDALKVKFDEGVRIFLFLFDDNFSENYLNDLITRNIFSSIRYAKIGKFFTVIADNVLSSFMPRNVLLDTKKQKYGYIFKDSDMTWFIIHNFFSGWFKASIIEEKKPRLPSSYTNQRIAINDLLTLKNSGLGNIKLLLIGVLRTSGERIELEGELEYITTEEDLINLTIKAKDGRVYSVGGFDSKVEEIIAKEITILG